MRYLILLAVLAAGCGSAGPGSADASDPNTTAATLADLQALTDKIAALEKRLAAVEKATGVDADGNPVTPAAPTYWLYDGNGVKKWKVGGTPDKENMVEVEPGFWQYYATDDHYSSNPANLTEAVWLQYSGPGCTGTAYLPYTQFNRIYTWSGWAMKVTKQTPVARNVAIQSYRHFSYANCAAYVTTLATGFAVASTYQASPATALPPFDIRPE